MSGAYDWPKRILLIGLTTVLMLAASGASLFLLMSAIWGFRDEDLVRVAADADGFIKATYKYREKFNRYPQNILDVKAVDGVAWEDGDSFFRQDDDNQRFCSQRCWQYFYFGDARPPELFIELDNHARLVYEFASSHGYYFPSGVDEGWILRQEGGARFLKSMKIRRVE